MHLLLRSVIGVQIVAGQEIGRHVWHKLPSEQSM